jgi:hypothetical protein
MKLRGTDWISRYVIRLRVSHQILSPAIFCHLCPQKGRITGQL